MWGLLMYSSCQYRSWVYSCRKVVVVRVRHEQKFLEQDAAIIVARTCNNSLLPTPSLKSTSGVASWPSTIGTPWTGKAAAANLSRKGAKEC